MLWFIFTQTPSDNSVLILLFIVNIGTIDIIMPVTTTSIITEQETQEHLEKSDFSGCLSFVFFFFFLLLLLLLQQQQLQQQMKNMATNRKMPMLAQTLNPIRYSNHSSQPSVHELRKASGVARNRVISVR